MNLKSGFLPFVGNKSQRFISGLRGQIKMTLALGVSAVARRRTASLLRTPTMGDIQRKSNRTQLKKNKKNTKSLPSPPAYTSSGSSSAQRPSANEEGVLNRETTFGESRMKQGQFTVHQRGAP